jgi:hypothetical protein
MSEGIYSSSDLSESSIVNVSESHAVTILRRLRQRLAEEGHRVQGEMMGKVADRLAAEDINRGLELLYAVQGWDEIALRLMWFEERARETGKGEPNEALQDYQVDELFALLMAVNQGGEVEKLPSEEHPGALTGEVFEALHHFNSALEDLKRTAFEGERFQGMREGLVDSALAHAGRLHQVSSTLGNEPLAQFAAAFSLFLRYVIEKDLFDDVRVAHLIDNACQSLQGLLEGTGGEDYEPLLQTIDMLHNPETLLE